MKYLSSSSLFKVKIKTFSMLRFEFCLKFDRVCRSHMNRRTTFKELNSDVESKSISKTLKDQGFLPYPNLIRIYVEEFSIMSSSVPSTH